MVRSWLRRCRVACDALAQPLTKIREAPGSTSASHRATLLTRVRARKAPTGVDRPIGYDGHTPVPLFGDVHDDEQREAYLDALKQGIGLDLAARQIDTTASRIRMLLGVIAVGWWL